MFPKFYFKQLRDPFWRDSYEIFNIIKLAVSFLASLSLSWIAPHTVSSYAGRLAWPVLIIHQPNQTNSSSIKDLLDKVEMMRRDSFWYRNHSFRFWFPFYRKNHKKGVVRQYLLIFSKVNLCIFKEIFSPSENGG